MICITILTPYKDARITRVTEKNQGIPYKIYFVFQQPDLSIWYYCLVIRYYWPQLRERNLSLVLTTNIEDMSRIYMEVSNVHAIGVRLCVGWWVGFLWFWRLGFLRFELVGFLCVTWVRFPKLKLAEELTMLFSIKAMGVRLCVG